jgi:mannitol/fructose-specific phosphotransferase system IIA component (Ntr-type)
VHAIVLMLSPESKPEDHLAAMEVIFGALSQDRFRKFLRQARSVSDITTLLEEADAAAPAR